MYLLKKLSIYHASSEKNEWKTPATHPCSREAFGSTALD